MFCRAFKPDTSFDLISISRGKGDYYRLGHGTEEHVRRPRRVEALSHKVITSISCGSLHCVVCTNDGEVYCWGDNDEGQLGDGTTNAGQLPKICNALQVGRGGVPLYVNFQSTTCFMKS